MVHAILKDIYETIWLQNSGRFFFSFAVFYKLPHPYLIWQFFSDSLLSSYSWASSLVFLETANSLFAFVNYIITQLT